MTACAACADLPDPKIRGTCISCLADYGPGAACATCLLPAEATSGSATTSSPPTLASGIDASKSSHCFKCVSDGGPGIRNSTACLECFITRTGAAVDTDSCLKCASDASAPAAARAGCGGCYDSSVLDLPGCLACLRAKGVESGEAAATCGSCSFMGMQPVTKQCYECLQTVGPQAAPMCSRLGQVKSRGLTMRVSLEACALVYPLWKGVGLKECLHPRAS